MTPVRILLVDDHDLVRTGIRLVLRHLQDVEVVGECGDGRQAVVKVEELKPDIVLMDIVMPGLNGLDATEQIVKKFPATRVIMLSMNAAEEYVLQSLHRGASGYLLKNVSPSVLDEAMRLPAVTCITYTMAVEPQARASSSTMAMKVRGGWPRPPSSTGRHRPHRPSAASAAMLSAG